MNFKELEQTAKSYIAKDQLEEAISLMSAYFKEESSVNEILLQSGRYHSLKKDQLNGTVDYTTIQTSFNQLRASMLTFLEKHQPTIHSESSSIDKKTMEEELKLSHARISILWLLQDNQGNTKGLTVSQIHHLAKTQNRKFIALALQELAKNGLVERERLNNTTYWCLTEKGDQLADKFKESSIWSDGGAVVR